VRDQIRVISLHAQQAGEVPWEADSRDRVMRDGKIVTCSCCVLTFYKNLYGAHNENVVMR